MSLLACRRAIVGIAGTVLSAGEQAILAAMPPVGVILFARNVEDRRQLRALTDELRAVTGKPDMLLLVDQEGGRVMRLRPPHWRGLPPMAAIGALHDAEPTRGNRAAWLVGRLIAHDLREVGIDVACAPVLDLWLEETTKAIGDRSFGGDVARVVALGRALRLGLEAGGVQGVVKHLPGHGRARADSHLELPVVTAGLDELRSTDFACFAGHGDAPLGMTCHVVYKAVDDARPATLSPVVIGDVIRGQIGFRGILMSDDLDMGALSGPKAERAELALAAGCDLAVVCRGDLRELTEVLAITPPVDGALAGRLRGLELVRGNPLPAAIATLETELADLLKVA